MRNIILRCLQCNDLFRPTAYDSYPAFRVDEQSDLITEIEMNDLDNFMMNHRGHEIAELQIIPGSFCSRYGYWEPIREDYFQATDGVEIYTVKRWREDVCKPLSYELIDANIEFCEPILRVQSVKLKRQMIADASILRLDADKIDGFIKRLENFVRDIELDDLIEYGLSTNDSAVSYATLKDEAMERLLIHCHALFTDEELDRLRVFIDVNSDYNDVMNIQIRRSFQLVPVTQHSSSLSKA